MKYTVITEPKGDYANFRIMDGDTVKANIYADNIRDAQVMADALNAPSFREKIQVIYLDWVNNFLSAERFAEYYGLTVEQAKLLIQLGSSVHEAIVAEHKANEAHKAKEAVKGFTPIPDYGVHMKIADWQECCESTMFVDYDGHGNLATDTEMSPIEVKPSQHRNKTLKPPHWATHVVWFNR